MDSENNLNVFNLQFVFKINDACNILKEVSWLARMLSEFSVSIPQMGQQER